MLTALANRPYRRLFTAQVVALVGTGLATVALGLLAYDLAGADAGAVLGTAFAIKMVAYVGVGPLAGALAARLPARGCWSGSTWRGSGWSRRCRGWTRSGRSTC